jgi:hypothetical protein
METKGGKCEKCGTWESGLGIARVGGNDGWKRWDEKGRGWRDGEEGIRRPREREVRGTTGGKLGTLDLVAGT